MASLPPHVLAGVLACSAASSPHLASLVETLTSLPLHAGFDALHFADAVPIGVRRPSGAVLLNPPPHFQLQSGDKLVVLAENDDTYDFNSVPMELGEEIKMLGEVVAVHIAQRLLKDGVYDTAGAEHILRGGGPGDYFSIGPEQLFRMYRPK